MSTPTIRKPRRIRRPVAKLVAASTAAATLAVVAVATQGVTDLSNVKVTQAPPAVAFAPATAGGN